MNTCLIQPTYNIRHASAIPASPTWPSRIVAAFSLLLMLCGMVAPATAQKVVPSYAKLPLSFESNHGQTDARVQFLSRGPGYTVYLTQGEAVLQLRKGTEGASAAESSVLRMKLTGASETATSQGEKMLPGKTSYFEGADPKNWKTGIPTFERVSYQGVYPGIDLVYYGNQRELEYDFVVAAGADPGRIALNFSGSSPRLDSANGDLVLPVNGSETRFHKPVVYQMNGNRRVPVQGAYLVAGDAVRFQLGAYDKSRALVIDPVLSYLTYLGGSQDDQIHGLAVDAQGNAIVVGTAYSTNFPLQNAYDSVPPQAGNYPHTVFVSKLNATGTGLVYSTYLGDGTQGAAVAVDPAGNAYVFSTTNDPNYPVTAGAFQTLCGANNYNSNHRITGCSTQAASGNNSTALTKISPDGTQLLYSTFLSGNNGQIARAIAVNSAGEAYVIGQTNAYCPPPPYNSDGTGYQAYDCFPVTANAADSSVGLKYGYDAKLFLTKFNAQGTGLVYSTLLDNHNPVGHSVSGMLANAIALDAAGNAYVTGNMDANYFITTTAGALQTSRLSSTLPAFVAKYNPAGTASTSLVYSTYLSGTTYSNDLANGIVVDGSGNAIVTGITDSCTYPTTAGAFSSTPNGYPSSNSCYGGFLTKLNATGSGLVWSTWTSNLGATGRVSDGNTAVTLAADDSVYLVGESNGSPLAPTVNPIMKQNESGFTYIKHFTADGTSLLLASAIGGTTDATSFPTGVALDPAGNIYLAGYTYSSTWPTTAGAFQKAIGSPGNNDGYIVKLTPVATTTTTLTLPAGTVTAGQSAQFTAMVAGQSGTTGTPTGTVTFLSGSTTLGTGTLDSTGTATYTAASLNATTYTITASYSGDTAFGASVSAAQNLVVAPATPTVTLTAPATALVGASVNLAVTVTGTTGTPTGTVTFSDGTTALGTATLASGAASYSTSTLAAGAHSITASYSGDSLFAAAVSAASTVTINAPSAISFKDAPTSLTIAHGGSGTVVITGTPVGGYTGTATFACGTLPTAASCSFAPASLSFTGSNTVQTTTLTLSTTTKVAALERPIFGRSTPPVYAAFLLLPLGFLVRGRRRNALKGLFLLLVIASASVFGMTGCGGGSKPAKSTTTTTPAGSYTVTVNITAPNGNTTLTIPVTVQ